MLSLPISHAFMQATVPIPRLHHTELAVKRILMPGALTRNSDAGNDETLSYNDNAYLMSALRIMHYHGFCAQNPEFTTLNGGFNRHEDFFDMGFQGADTFDALLFCYMYFRETNRFNEVSDNKSTWLSDYSFKPQNWVDKIHAANPRVVFNVTGFKHMQTKPSEPPLRQYLGNSNYTYISTYGSPEINREIDCFVRNDLVQHIRNKNPMNHTYPSGFQKGLQSSQIKPQDLGIAPSTPAYHLRRRNAY